MKTQKSKLFTIAVALVTLGSGMQRAEAAASFVFNIPMQRARYAHSMTLLPNGNVLVAGGYSSTVTELFDPGTGTWTMTGRLGAARTLHTATLLPNGKVLVAGGGDPATASAELYDPASGTWSFTGSMNNVREGHTATLLPNGKVLVAGGFFGGGFGVSAAELYDPATGRWTTTGEMGRVRDSHTANLLPNGKVLVAAGYNRGGPPGPIAELYDPLTGTWTATGSPGFDFADHTSTLLPNGKVLIAGGCPCRDAATNNVRNAELYDPASETWTPTSSMITGRGLHTATLLLSGKVLVTGGYSAPPQTSAELYDATTETWTPTGGMTNGRWWHRAALLLNGNVLVSGGNGSSGSIPTAEIYQSSSEGAGGPRLNFQLLNNQLVLSWTNAAYFLQTTPAVPGTFKIISGATSPYTNPLVAPQQFFRLQLD